MAEQWDARVNKWVVSGLAPSGKEPVIAQAPFERIFQVA